MKQRITVKQLTEITHEQKLLLHSVWNPQLGDSYAWYEERGSISKEIYLVRDTNAPWDDLEAEPKQFALPILSIGQMIEFIQEKKPLLKGISKNRFDKWFVNIENGMLGYKDELCDALWETVKQLLKQP